MRILITGANGFVGGHLLDAVRGADCTPIPCDIRLPDNAPAEAGWRKLDVRDAAAVETLVADTAPDACLHLAGITSIKEGSDNPDLMLSVNVRGTVNLLTAFQKQAPAARILVVSSAHVYGTPSDTRPLAETAALAPLTMYAISKAAADLAALAWATHNGLHVMTARPNNHTGPGQDPRFVVAAFAEQVRAIARGDAPPRLRVGNLESRRDFSDVRDIVRAYLLLLAKGKAGQAYNISAQHHETVGAVLKRLCAMADIDPSIESDPELWRPKDGSPVLDTTRLQDDTGWLPSITLDQTLQAVLKQP